jgi:hypothetical protein
MTKPLTRVLTLTTTIAALGIAANLSVKPVEAATITIDDFTVQQGVLFGSVIPGATVSGPGSSLLGGFRTLTIDTPSPTPPLVGNPNVTIDAGDATFSGPANRQVQVSLLWDGNGGTPSGLGGVNLSGAILGGNPRFIGDISNAQNLAGGSLATLSVFEVGNATPAVNTIDLTTVSFGDQLEFLYSDFTGPAINFGNVGAIRLTIKLVSPGVGSVPSFAFGTPLVAIPFNFQSTLGLLALGGLGGAYMLSKKSKKALQA